MPLRSHRRGRTLATATIACALVAPGSAAPALGAGDRDAKLADLGALLTGQKSPDRANDVSCRPTARHPRPVVLVHGTFNTSSTTRRAASWPASTCASRVARGA